MLKGLFTARERVFEKSQESIVSCNVAETRIRRSWRCVSGGSESDKVKRKPVSGESV